MELHPRKVAALALATMLAPMGTAEAAILATPTLQKTASQEFLCRIVNLDKKPIKSGEFRIVGSDGSPLVTETMTGVGAGLTGSIVYANTQTIGYCVAEGKFSKKKFAITLCLTNGDSECLATVTAP
jgi:hypothetical protein